MKPGAQKQKIASGQSHMFPCLADRASLAQACTSSLVSLLRPHPQVTTRSTTHLASNTVHQGTQTDGRTQTHINGCVLKCFLVGHIKKIKRCHKHPDFLQVRRSDNTRPKFLRGSGGESRLAATSFKQHSLICYHPQRAQHRQQGLRSLAFHVLSWHADLLMTL